MVTVLDEFEGHPYCYTRDKISVRITQLNGALPSTNGYAAGDVVTCDTYLMRGYRQEVLTTESFVEDYTDSADCRYVLRKDRPAGVTSSVLLKESFNGQ